MERFDSRCIPEKAQAGLDFSVCFNNRAYPATEWSAKLLFRGPAPIDIVAVPVGSAQTFTAASTVTATWLPGLYCYSVRVQSATETREVENGQIEFLPDFASLPAGYDGRTVNEIAYDAISAVVANRATQDQQRYTIGDRELWRTPMGDLLKLKASYSAAVRRERAVKNGHSRFGRVIPVRFG